ncbi:hypothetical protein J2T57_001280 [Natronocella acetinitrilica]|uniref:Uncharacterized protein n=1 Tax=Natronocella acetinitrilica TaxID=414046 RepID=A0AAE3KBW2_9GAMM|nr:hypothetical protein [Natronocella acetinitrilica]MCP1674178.1 hypothetical protein [Natronocella acetinitrilica]
MSENPRAALIDAFTELNRDFATEYRGLWSRGGAEEQALMLADWVRELERAEVSAAGLRAAHERVKADPAYRNYPPKRRAFIDLALEMQRAPQGDTDILEAVAALHRGFGFRYGALWPRREQSEEQARAQYWAAALSEAGLGASDVRAGEAALSSAEPFAQHPPTMDQFTEHCLAAIDTCDAPGVSAAFLAAASAPGTCAIHPLVAEARRRVGAHELRTRASDALRAEFSRVYRELRAAYRRGSLDLEVSAPVQGAEPAPAVADRESLVRTLDTLIERYRG